MCGIENENYDDFFSSLILLLVGFFPGIKSKRFFFFHFLHQNAFATRAAYADN